MRTRAIYIAAALIVVPAVTAWGDDPEKARETFDSLFAKDLATVKGTGSATDDVTLADRLVETAEKATGQPAFLTLLCEHAYRLASGHPTGYAAAIRAMELVAGCVPEKAAEAQERILAVRRKQIEASRGDERKAVGEALLDSLLALIQEKHKAGDETEAAALYREAQTVAKAAGSERLAGIERAADGLAQRIRIAQRIRDVLAILERDPKNVSAREGLVRLYVVHVDDPEKAAEVLAGAEDADLKKYVPAAAKPIEAAPELACLELGEWYGGLAESAPDYAKAAMYVRARAYLERFLSLHQAKDLDRARGEVVLGKTEEALAQLAAGSQPAAAKVEPKKPPEPAAGIQGAVIKPGKWVDLLPLLDPAKDGVAGNWSKPDKTVRVTAAGSARAELPVSLDGSYELVLRFVRMEGQNAVMTYLPAGAYRCVLLLSVFGAKLGRGGLAFIDGKPLYKNGTMVRPCRLDNGRQYVLYIQVRVEAGQAQIDVDLDDKSLVRWRGEESALSVGSYGTLRHPRSPGLGVNECDVVWHQVRLRMLSGEARLLRPAG